MSLFYPFLLLPPCRPPLPLQSPPHLLTLALTTAAPMPIGTSLSTQITVVRGPRCSLCGRRPTAAESGHHSRRLVTDTFCRNLEAAARAASDWGAQHEHQMRDVEVRH